MDDPGPRFTSVSFAPDSEKKPRKGSDHAGFPRITSRSRITSTTRGRLICRPLEQFSVDIDVTIHVPNGDGRDRVMDAIRKFLVAQIRKTPGEWIRAHILDGALGVLYAHLPFAWTSIAVAALVGLTSGLLTWSRHDPGLAIFVGVISLLAVLCVALVATVLWEKYRTRPTTTVPASGVSPLEIVFDLNNPGEQFWKRRQGKDANGNLIPKMVLEHRIGVRNTSSMVRPFAASALLALRPAHSRGHLYVTCYTEGFSHFVTSMTAPVASGWSGCRVGLAPTGKRRLVTAHT